MTNILLFQDWSRDITKILEKRPAAEIKKKYKEIYDMLLEMPHKGEQSGTQAQQTSFGAVSMGEFHRRFAEVGKCNSLIYSPFSFYINFLGAILLGHSHS